MKKITIIIMLAIVGYSANAQWKQPVSHLRKNGEVLLNLPINKNAIKQNPKSLIALNDSIYNWSWGTLTWAYVDKTIHIVSLLSD